MYLFVTGLFHLPYYSPRFIYVVACVRNSFFLRLNNSLLYVCKPHCMYALICQYTPGLLLRFSLLWIMAFLLMFQRVIKHLIGWKVQELQLYYTFIHFFNIYWYLLWVRCHWKDGREKQRWVQLSSTLSEGMWVKTWSYTVTLDKLCSPLNQTC